MPLPTRIPTWLGILLLVIMVVGLVFFFEGQRLPTRASPSIVPQQVEITNITEQTFTVSWLTASPATGALVVEGAGTKQLIFDERDLSQAQGSRRQGKYITHSVTVRGVEPQAEYKVKLVVNGKIFLDSEEKPYLVKTAPQLSGGSSLEPAFGTVMAGDQPADGALVYLTLEGGQVLSTVVKSSGSWIIPLNLARTRDLSQYLKGERLTENIEVRFDGQKTVALTDTLNDSPVPEMILGKTYDFRRQQGQAESSLAQTQTSSTSVLGETTGPTLGTFTIVKPAQGAALTTTLPLVQGTGLAGKSVVVTLGITQPSSGTTTVGADGIWRFTPTKPLAPGKQAVTATSQDTRGKPVAVTQTFEILKEGTQVLGEATPSATLTPTFTPTEAASPTPTSTLSGQPLPQSGSILPTLILLLLGLGLFGSGAVMLAK